MENEKEKISKDIDQTVKRIDEKIEKILDEILPEAFAIMKDTARRFTQNETVEVTATDFDRNLAAHKDFVTIEGDKAIYATHWMAAGNDLKWEMIHYDVQLFGGVVLHKGKIAEMATGEGKTLVATLPVFLNALTGNGVHVVTVNDYLAKRDSEWMGPLYMFHGLTVDCIDKAQPNSEARRQAYLADITFGTNNEFGFDYLRDNMANAPKDLVQRKHHFAIVDEVDSVLIDDARTPLIISGPVPKGEDQLFEEYRPAIVQMLEKQNIHLQARMKKGFDLAEEFGGNMTPQEALAREDSLLETKYPEFGNLMREYYDGLLFFEVSTKEVWDKAANDETGLGKYFKKNRKKYKFDSPRCRGAVIHANSQENLDMMKNMLAGKHATDYKAVIEKELPKDSARVVRVEIGMFAIGDNAWVDKLIFNQGDGGQYRKGYDFVDVIGQVISAPETYKDVKAAVQNDYQKYLEEKWVKALRKKYKVSVDKKVLKTVNNHN